MIADPSLNHFVRAQQYCLWDRQPERPRRLEIDDEFKLDRLLNGKVGRLRTFKDLVDVGRGAPGQVGEAWCVG